MKHWNRNIWSNESIANATLFHLPCNCKKDLVSLESYFWTWAQRRKLTPRQSCVLYFASGNYQKNVYWSIGVLMYISKYPPKIVNVRYFNNLCWTSSQSVFLKSIWEHFTLHCEHCRWSAWTYSVDYQSRSRTIAPCKVKRLATIVHNFQPLAIVIKNSILDAVVPKFNLF